MEKNKEEKQKPGFILGHARQPETSKVEAKPEYHEHQVVRTGRYNNLILVVLLFTVVFVVVALVYALYVFFHNSRLANVANLHYSENMKEAARQLVKEGKITGFQTEEGYAGWLVYRGEKLEFKYPGDWEVKSADEYTVIRKFNRKLYGYFDSLAVSIEIKDLPNPENLEISEFLKANDFFAGERKIEVINEKEVLLTGAYDDPRGFVEKSAYWPLEGRVVRLDAVFYNQDYEDLFDEFEKIVQSVKISG